jgi:hypothetical protein
MREVRHARWYPRRLDKSSRRAGIRPVLVVTVSRWFYVEAVSGPINRSIHEDRNDVDHTLLHVAQAGVPVRMLGYGQPQKESLRRQRSGNII